MARLKRPETVAATAARHIRDAIVAGEYPPGAPLPEVWLARELGAARGTVREALRELGEMGLVDVVPRRGSFVSPVTRQRARELYELRAGLEGLAARLATEHGQLGPGARDELEARLAAMDAARGGEAMALIEAERALHREIWSRCGNQQLIGFLTGIQVQTRRLLVHNKSLMGDARGQHETHQALVDEVLSGDPDRAEAAVRRHVHASAERVLARMPDDRETAVESSEQRQRWLEHDGVTPAAARQ